MNLTGLAEFFGDNIFSSYEVDSWKPDPGLFLHAAKSMAADPSDCVVIEDSEAGLAAADAAGMEAVFFHVGDGGSGDVRSISELRELPRLIASIG